MKPLLAWASDHFGVPLPEHHPFPIEKYGMLRRRLLDDGVLSPREIGRSEPAPLEWLALAHDVDYLERLVGGRMEAAEMRRIGMPWSAGLVARARATVFGTVSAARAALVHGIAGNLAGGTHHAFRDRGEGYCLFNDVAVAIALLRAGGLVERPFVCDLDVHQGNGTAAMFAHDPAVCTLSLHGAGNYPLVKERSDVDVELPDGAGDAEYLDALERHLPEAFARHGPDLMFYQAGVDALACDRFGRLALTHEGLAERDRRVFAVAEARGVAVVVTLGGGYGRPIEHTVAAHANTWRAARAARERRPVVHSGDGAAHAVHHPQIRG